MSNNQAFEITKPKKVLVLKPSMSLQEMYNALYQQGYDVYDFDNHEVKDIPRIIKYATEEYGYNQEWINGEMVFKKPSLSPNDLKALAWVQEHQGQVRFRKGHIRFNDDGSIDQNMACPNQTYVEVRVGFKEREAKTIEDATLQLQAWYYGTQWTEELKADLYA